MHDSEEKRHGEENKVIINFNYNNNINTCQNLAFFTIFWIKALDLKLLYLYKILRFQKKGNANHIKFCQN